MITTGVDVDGWFQGVVHRHPRRVDVDLACFIPRITCLETHTRTFLCAVVFISAKIDLVRLDPGSLCCPNPGSQKERVI